MNSLKVYYKKKSNFLESTPSYQQFVDNYELVWEGEAPDYWDEDEIFECFNSEAVDLLIPRLPEGVRHSSMSVGDIIYLNGRLLLCTGKGWKQLDLMLIN